MDTQAVKMRITPNDISAIEGGALRRARGDLTLASTGASRRCPAHARGDVLGNLRLRQVAMARPSQKLRVLDSPKTSGLLCAGLAQGRTDAEDAARRGPGRRVLTEHRARLPRRITHVPLLFEAGVGGWPWRQQRQSRRV